MRNPLFLLLLALSCTPHVKDDPDVATTETPLRECEEGEQLGYVPPEITCVPIGSTPIDHPCDAPDACVEGAACVPDIHHSDIISPGRYILGDGVCRAISDRAVCADGHIYQTLVRTTKGAFDTLVLFSKGDPLLPVMSSPEYAFGFCIRACNEDCGKEPMFCGKDHEEDPEPNSCLRRKAR